MNIAAAALAVACACLTSCLTHRVEMAPIEVRPIHVTVDVNVRVQRELDEFFDFDAPAAASKPGDEEKE